MDFLKGVLLKLKGYKNPKAYWDLRWKLKLNAEKWTPELIKKEFDLINGLMKKNDCQNILDVGCGEAKLRDLSGYVGFDFSEVSLQRSGLQNYLVGSISNKDLDVADKSFDAMMTRFVLLHIPFNQIEIAVNNMCRIAKKLIMLREPESEVPKQTAPHCFSHNLKELFKRFDGKVVFLNEVST